MATGEVIIGTYDDYPSTATGEVVIATYAPYPSTQTGVVVIGQLNAFIPQIIIY